MNKEVVLITSHFPYYPGEEFLETEITYWGKLTNTKITIMPSKLGKTIRNIPDNISLDHSIIDNERNVTNLVINIFRAVVSRIFYREVYQQIITNPKRLLSGLISCTKYLRYRSCLDIYLAKNRNRHILFYTYWHNEATYALQSLRDEHTFSLVTRAHRHDIYEEIKVHNYMPLRRQFLNNVDIIYTITPSAIDYLVRTYGFSPSILKVSRLGVETKGIVSQPSEKGIFHIVSCSFIVKIKRIDKIIFALEHLSKRTKSQIKWSHIGSGDMVDVIKELADERLRGIGNIEYQFLGHLDNTRVYEFYKKNKVDVFVNSSESEGVPVSIMEAMSCRIPIIAPDIGGVSDMIKDGYSGTLLNSDFSVNELAKALRVEVYYKNSVIRNNAFQAYLHKYNAEENYPMFIQMVGSI